MKTIDSSKARELATNPKHNRLLRITMREIEKAAKSGAIETSIDLKKYGYRDVPKYYVRELISLGYYVGTHHNLLGNYVDINWGKNNDTIF